MKFQTSGLRGTREINGGLTFGMRDRILIIIDYRCEDGRKRASFKGDNGVI
jgi:hypothetical protein